MASITTWTRLEPRARGDDLTPSLEARVYDPAWLLGRQWQLGEFVGEDAGSPADVRLEVESAPIVAMNAGGGIRAVDPGPPLDVLAGAEQRTRWSLADRVEAGAELLDLLAEAGCSADGVAALVGARLLPDPEPAGSTSEGMALLDLAAGRLPDVELLSATLEAIASGAPPSDHGVPERDAAAVAAAARAWVQWRDTLVQFAHASAWIDERLEHRFRLAVKPPRSAAYTLAAPAWNGDSLDWYDLDVDRRIAAPARPAAAPPPAPLPAVDPRTGRVTASGLPAPLAYPGMPAPRWWQFEDARVNFAEITAAPEDLARMLVVEFASVYANDWYLWPLVLPVGAVHTVVQLDVTNTFGETTRVRPIAATGGPTVADWQLFRPTEHPRTGASRAFNGLLLLPTLASPLDGEPFEEVRFLRDELANLAWAIEARVRGQDGSPWDRHSAAAIAGELRPAPPALPTSDTEPLRYRFSTDVPAYWFPLVPDAAGASVFRRLILRRVDSAGQVQNVAPAGQLIAPDGFWLWQEEVPREGARVVRRHRLARGTDGIPYAWSTRRTGTGRGEGSSGLRYDEGLPFLPPEE
ncbi:MAG: hypothetical protein AB7O32_09720 [Vicinamibacterales bacterium]